MPKIFEANPHQELFLLSLARYLGFFGGIGSGKTAAGSIKSVLKLEDGDGIVVGPDFPHLTRSTWPEFKKWIPWSRVINSHLNHPHTSEKVLKIQTANGIRNIYYGGMEEAGSWAGPSVNWAWADEFRRKPTRQHFDVLAGRIRVGKNPQLWLTTTPKGTLKGKRHWLFEIFVEQKFDPDVLKEWQRLGLGSKLTDYFVAPTQENAAHLDPLYYASLRGLYTGKYASQELGGDFIEFEGLVYEEFTDEPGGNVTEEAEYVPGVPIEWGVDDGFTDGHPRVVLMAQTIPPYVNVFAEYIVTREKQEKSIENALKMGYPKPVVARVDSSAAELIQRLWDEGIETHRGSHDVDAGIAHLRSFIRNGRGQVHLRFHPRCTFSIAEIQAYAFPDVVETNISPGSDRAARPLKEADNAADAARYLVWPKQIATLDYMAAAAGGIRIPTMDMSMNVQQPMVTPATQREEPLRAPVDVRRTVFGLFGSKPKRPRPQRTPSQFPKIW